MEFNDVINKRTSVRSYEKIPVIKENMARILEASMLAPSWKNKASYKFIIVEDMEKKELLSKTILNDTQNTELAIKEAPLTAIIVANPKESGVVVGKEYYLVDSAIAMEHLILAATNEGYGTCWIGAFDEDKIREIFSIPSDYRVVGMTPVGISNEETEQHHKKEIAEHVYLDNWEQSYC